MMWLSLLEQHPEYFRDGVEIASFFGTFPPALWNGGRLVPDDQCDAGFVRNVIKAINSHKIPVRYTFTNPLITEADLEDPFCNFLMREASGGMNEVLVFSPILEKYLREKYPSFAYDSTTCKEIRDADELARELEKDYRYVVLDYNLNGRWDILENLPHREKLEVLVNPLCIPDCPRRGDHYKNIAKNQNIMRRNAKLPPQKRQPLIPWTCEYGDYNNLYTIQGYSTFVSPEKIWNEYVPRGINNFKIEGRTANLFSLIETYCFFMLKPETAGAARLLLLRNLEQAKVINVSRPRPGVWP